VIAIWVRSEEDDPELIQAGWRQCVEEHPNLQLQILESPYASLIDPFVEFVNTFEQGVGEESLTIVMPMAITRRLLDGMLLNQKALNLRLALDASHNRIFTIVRYYPPA